VPRQKTSDFWGSYFIGPPECLSVLLVGEMGEVAELEPVDEVWIDEVSLVVSIEGKVGFLPLEPAEWAELLLLDPEVLLIVDALTVERTFGKMTGAGAWGRAACSGAE